MKALRTLLFRVAMFILLYVGLYRDEMWAWNIARFVICVSFAISLLLLLVYAAATPKNIDELDRKNLENISKESLPPWLDGVFDVGVVLWLAAAGHFVFASLWTLSWIQFSVVRSKAKEHLKERDKNKSTL